MELRGLLENEYEDVYPDISTELPGMELEVKECDFTLVSDKSKVNFCELAGGVVTANIESLYIRNYELTMTVFKFKIFSRTLYSNLRVFLVIL